MLHYFLLWVLMSLLWVYSLGFSLKSINPGALPIDISGKLKLEGNGLMQASKVVFQFLDSGDNITFPVYNKTDTQMEINNVISSIPIYATVQMAYNNGTFSPSLLLFQFYKQPLFRCCMPSDIPFHGDLRVTISGANFFNSGNIKVKLTSAWSEKEISGSYVDSKTIVFTSPSAPFSNDFPDTSVKVSMTMDGKHYSNMSSGSGFQYVVQAPIKLAFVFLGGINDLGWTYSQNQGRKEVEVRYQGSVQTEYTKSTPEITPFINDNYSQEYKDSLEVILEFCKRNFSIIFAGSIGHMEQGLVASKSPICQQQPTHIVVAAGEIIDENLSAMFSKVYQAKYLAGMTAGYKLGKTPRNSMCVGYLGGLAIAEVYRGANAFLLGCQKANPKCKVHLFFLMQWENETLESDAAQYMWEVEKCDIIAQETDSAMPSYVYNGKKGFSIGYNSDQSAVVGDSVLTSAYLRWSILYSHFIDKLMNNDISKGEKYWPGMTEDAASLYAFSNEVDAITRSRVTDSRTDLENGKLKVFCNTTQHPLIISEKNGKKMYNFSSTDFKDNCLTDAALLKMTYPLNGIVLPLDKGPTKQGQVEYVFNFVIQDRVPIFNSPIVPKYYYSRDQYLSFVIISLLISSLGIIFTCGAGGFMFKHRANEWFTEHSIVMLWFILLGILILFMLPILYYPERTDHLCSINAVFSHLIIFLIMPPICLKTLRLHLKCQLIKEAEHRRFEKEKEEETRSQLKSPQQGSPQENCDIELPKSFTDDNKKLIYIVLLILLGFFVYSSIWLTFSPPKAAEFLIENAEDDKLYVIYCTQPSFELILLIPELLSLIVALSLILTHPKGPKKFNEVRFIAFSLYTVIVIAMIVFTVNFTTGNEYPILSDILFNFGVVVVASAFYVSLFAVKISKVMGHKILQAAGPKLSISMHNSKRNGGSMYLGSTEHIDSGVSKTASSANLHTFSDTNSPQVSTYNFDSSSKPLTNDGSATNLSETET